jgi:hypothetical protein
VTATKRKCRRTCNFFARCRHLMNGSMQFNTKPRAMMIKSHNTVVATWAVWCSRWAVHYAYSAIVNFIITSHALFKLEYVGPYLQGFRLIHLVRFFSRRELIIVAYAHLVKRALKISKKLSTILGMMPGSMKMHTVMEEYARRLIMPLITPTAAPSK